MNTKPLVIIAAISVIVLSLVGVAAITGILPSAISQQKTESEAKAKTNKSLQNQNKAQHKVANACANCGVIESIKTIETKGEGTGLGAVAGGVAGAVVGNQFGNGNGRTAMTVAGAAGGAYAGNEIEKHVKRTVKYQINVRMEDGTIRTTSQDTQPGFAVGEKVKIIDGAIVARNAG
jgi:outer membrane lipoprotein SlyB